MHRSLMAVFALVMLVGANSALAQRGVAPSHFSFNRGYGTSAFWRGGSLYPFFPPDIYDADALNAGYPVAAQPPFVILQAPSMAAPEPRVTGEPVLIELRGDAYVRLSGPPVSGATTLDLPTAHGETSAVHGSQAQAAQQASSQSKSTVLIFRDGHREDVSDYVIANGMLYAHTNYYTAGTWTKTVDVSSLDVAETVSYNSDHGVRFQLPNAANEVMVGP